MGQRLPVLFILCWLFVGQGVFAISWPWSRMEKRDDAPFVPVRRDIQLKFDALGRYLATVSMANNTQHFQFTMSSQSGLTYVTGTQCSTCDDVNLYNQSASTTASNFMNITNVAIFNSTAPAYMVKENCSLTTVNGSQWYYPNQTIVVMNHTASRYQDTSGFTIGDGLNGMIGIGTNRNLAPRSSNSSAYSGNFEDSIMGQWLRANPQADSFTFGMALNSPVAQAALRGVPSSNATGGSTDLAGTPAGVVHMLQPDRSAFVDSSIAWAQVNNSLNAQDDPQDWTVAFDGWTLVTDDGTNSHTKQITANIDPLYQGLYLPLDQASLIHAAIPGSVQLPAVSTLGSLAQTWRLPCDAKFSFSIVLNTRTYTLNHDVLVIKQDDGTCLSGIEAWTSSDLNSYLFGARFISAFYLIYNVPRNGPASIGFANRVEQNAHNKPVGAIVGGTIGGVALLVFTGLAIWFIRRRYYVKPYAYGMQEEEKHVSVQPYPLSPQTASLVSPTQSSYYQTIHYTGSSVPGSEPSPSQILFSGTQVSNPSPIPNTTALFAQNIGSEDVPPAYESGAQTERSADVKDRNLYRTDSNNGGGSSSGQGPQ